MLELRDRRILLCVGGGIAAYKACELARLLVKAGARVRCALTPAAQKFVGPLTFQSLTGEPVATAVLEPSQELVAGHIGLADFAELAIVAPATADLLARLRLGLADDAVTAALIAIPPRLWLLAPAMNERMWDSPATQENLAVLAARGAGRVGPAAGEMAERSHRGLGRLSEPAEIFAAAVSALQGTRPPRDLEGLRVLVTAGPTREPLDPVRFLSNPSTGRMGFAVAEAARDRGAQVVLLSGPTEARPPAGLDVVHIQTALELEQAVAAHLAGAAVVVMAAAVSDQRPAACAPQKVKKQEGEELLRLVRTPDILAALGARFAGATDRPLLVGFAAETERVEEHAREKLVRKKLDLIVANDVSEPGAGFGHETNRVLLLDAGGRRTELQGTKLDVAHGLWTAIRERLGVRAKSPADGAATP